jgi:hypothetical protein
VLALRVAAERLGVASLAEVEPTAELQASTSEFHSRTEFMFNSATWPREKARACSGGPQHTVAVAMRRADVVPLRRPRSSACAACASVGFLPARPGAQVVTDAARVAQMEADFSQLAREFGATRSTLRVPEFDARPRMGILVSQIDHCLTELLHRWEGARPAVAACAAAKDGAAAAWRACRSTAVTTTSAQLAELTHARTTVTPAPAGGELAVDLTCVIRCVVAALACHSKMRCRRRFEQEPKQKDAG